MTTIAAAAANPDEPPPMGAQAAAADIDTRRSSPPTLASGEPGRLERLPDLALRHAAARPVDVWLPPDFRADRGHGVLVMHDGQMAFDPAGTWNGQAWQVHRAVTSLMAQGRIPPTLVVAVWNRGGDRIAEYFPQRALAYTPEHVRARYIADDCRGRPQGEDYLRFLVDVVLPAVDERYALARVAERTVVLGSSMGGLASLTALCEYPHVFGAAGALSTHWPGRSPAQGLDAVRNAALPLGVLQYLLRSLPDPGMHRLWVDRGDDALDRLYAPGLDLFAEVLHERGYEASHAMVRAVSATGHAEADWAKRVGDVLAFLLAH